MMERDYPGEARNVSGQWSGHAETWSGLATAQPLPRPPYWWLVSPARACSGKIVPAAHDHGSCRLIAGTCPACRGHRTCESREPGEPRHCRRRHPASEAEVVVRHPSAGGCAEPSDIASVLHKDLLRVDASPPSVCCPTGVIGELHHPRPDTPARDPGDHPAAGIPPSYIPSAEQPAPGTEPGSRFTVAAEFAGKVLACVFSLLSPSCAIAGSCFRAAATVCGVGLPGSPGAGQRAPRTPVHGVAIPAHPALRR